MRLLIIFTFFTFIYAVFAKGHVKSLTQSMGQEIIEMGALKELPPGLEEEPSAEADDDVRTTASSLQPGTKRDAKKIAAVPATSKHNLNKNLQKIDGYHEDDEARIEKELAEIYKDTADYKSENSGEVTANKGATSATKVATSAAKEATSAVTTVSTVSAISENSTYTISDYDKPIARQGANFRFQPNSNNKADIERFRTSIDDIKCDRRVTQKLLGEVRDAVAECGNHTKPNNGLSGHTEVLGDIILEGGSQDEPETTEANSAVLRSADFKILSVVIFFIKSLF